MPVGSSSKSKRITKKSIAIEIFRQKKLKGLTRLKTIERFKKEAKLTENGASTYYSNFNGGIWASEV